MKTALYFVLAALSVSISQAQAPGIQFQKSYGGSGNDYACDARSTLDGGFILAGAAASNDGDASGNHGNSDFWIVKVDALGNLQWQKQFGGSNSDIARRILPTSDGGYVVVGETASNNGDVTGNQGGLNDYWVVRLDATGSIQWQKTLGGSNNDGARAVQATADGGFLIAGTSNSLNGNVSGNHGNYDNWLVKLDATGSIQWEKSLGGTGRDELQDMVPTPDGGFVLTGLSNTPNNGDVTGNHGSFDYWVVKIDEMANIQWQNSYGGSGGDESTGIRITPDGGYIAVGTSFSDNGDVTGQHGLYDYWVVKIDSTGMLQWQKCLGGSALDAAYAVQCTADGGFIVVGEGGASSGDITGNHGGYDAWVTKLNSEGALLWQKAMGGSADERAVSMLNTSEGGYMILGRSSSNNGDVTGNHGNSDFWLVKLSPDALSTDIHNEIDLVVYPNPAYDFLHIQVSPDVNLIKVQISDLKGKTVMERCDTDRINIQNLEQGIYILEVSVGERTFARKFVKK